MLREYDGIVVPILADINYHEQWLDKGRIIGSETSGSITLRTYRGEDELSPVRK